MARGTRGRIVEAGHDVGGADNENGNMAIEAGQTEEENTIDPGSITGPGPGTVDDKPRKRKPYAPRRKRADKEAADAVSLGASDIAGVLLFATNLLAASTQIPECQINEIQANAISSRALVVLENYPINVSRTTAAWGMLGLIVGGVAVAQYQKYKFRVEAERNPGRAT